MAQPGELPSGKAIYRYFRDVGDAAIDTLYLNMADYLGARGPDLGRQEWVDYCSVIEHILLEGTRQEIPKASPRLLDGHDIMDTFSIGSGPEVGSLLELVEEAYSSGEVSTREGAMNLVRNSLELRD
jgi:poly(A) polymerase